MFANSSNNPKIAFAFALALFLLSIPPWGCVKRSEDINCWCNSPWFIIVKTERCFDLSIIKMCVLSSTEYIHCNPTGSFDKNPFRLVALVTGPQRRSIKCITTLTTLEFSRFLTVALTVCMNKHHHGRPNRFWFLQFVSQQINTSLYHSKHRTRCCWQCVISALQGKQYAKQ